ncbi:MAG TPA: hypothetical protein VF715_19000 [Thermoleophilaceae bacterium]
MRSTDRACFMHVHKAAGTSMRRMLEAALPPGSLAPRRIEAANFCGFDDFDGLSAEARSVVAANEAELRELADYPVICGHMTLPTLERFAPPGRIATILREPRARVISYYLHLRTSVPLRTIWSHYGVHRFGDGTLAQFLSDRRVARMSDNRICRMVLHGDPRIRDGEFIAERHLGELGEEAAARLDELGFVGIVEEPDEARRGVGRLFGIELELLLANVTGAGEVAPGGLPAPPFGGAETLDLLERRSAADAIAYRHVVARAHGAAGAARLAGAAFADALVRYGSFTATALAELDSERHALAEARGHLHESTRGLERHEALLEAVTRSRSWRYTAPLRRGLQRLRRGG